MNVIFSEWICFVFYVKTVVWIYIKNILYLFPLTKTFKISQMLLCSEVISLLHWFINALFFNYYYYELLFLSC